MGNKKKRSKLLVLLLVLAMIFTALPAALAENVADSADTSQTETKATEESSDAITTDQSTTDTDAAQDEQTLTDENAEEESPAADEQNLENTEDNSADSDQALTAAAPMALAASATSGTGRTYTLTATVKDASGNLLSGIPVEFVRTDSNGNGDSTTAGSSKPYMQVNTDSNGVATATITVNHYRFLDYETKSFSYSIVPSNASYDYSPVSASVTVTVTRDAREGYSWSIASGTPDNTFTAVAKSYDAGSNPTKEDFTEGLSKTLTPLGNDEYNITLTAPGLSGTTTKPLEYVLVIDRSGSMDYAFTTIGDVSMTRMQYLKYVLTRDGGFIDQLYAKAEAGQVKISVVSFSEGAGSTNQALTTSAASVKSAINALNAADGTNYCGGLAQANSVLKSGSADAIQNLVFLSDGQPTFYLNGSNGLTGSAVGNDGYSTGTNTYRQTKKAIDTIFANYPNVNSYSINYGGSGQVVTVASGADAGTKYNFLAAIASKTSDSTKYTTKNVFDAATPESLLAALNNIASVDLTDLTITDPLSAQVSYLGADLTDPDSHLQVFVDTLSEGLSTTPLADSEYTVDTATNSITLNSPLGKGKQLRVSFDITANNKAYSELFEKDGAYPDNGGAGFYSNASAGASGSLPGTDYTGAYTNPTFTLAEVELTLQKVADGTTTGLPGAVFSLQRTDPENAQDTGVTRTGLTTDATGHIELKGLCYGSYTLTETSPPDGYQKLTESVKFSVAKDGTTTYISGPDEVKWEPGNSILLTVSNKLNEMGLDLLKINGDENLLAGAEFTVYSDEACTTVIGTATSGTDGAVKFTVDGTDTFKYKVDVPFYLKETKAPADQVLNGTLYQVTLNPTASLLKLKSSTEGWTDATTNDLPSIVNSADNSYATVTFANYEQAPLPLTGGDNNLWYLTAGLIALAGGGFLIYRHYVIRRTGGRI